MRNPELLRELREIYNKYDLMGILGEENLDEYDPEINSTLDKIKPGMSIADVQKTIYQEFVFWFGEDLIGDFGEFQSLSEEVYAVFKNRELV